MQLHRMNSLQMPQLGSALEHVAERFFSLPGIHRQLGGLPHLQAGSLVQGYPLPILHPLEASQWQPPAC